ncbi:MAG: D-cysteine desulfhydrase family protein [Anaerolineae bacterium]|nr:D-cysteine desulfhydrase family protein [Anaerolineae bacterium]
MLTDRQPRVSMAHLPTPLEPLPRLTAALGGPQLWVKRDDQTGLATGGNKTRKLEFLVAEALAQGADTLVTCGAGQSNHARQTAAAAARFGFRCTLVLRGPRPAASQGNLLLDRLLGAEIAWAEDVAVDERLEKVMAELGERGRRPYLIPYGGSNPVGATGYVAAMEELLAQCAQRGLGFDGIVLASSSGGTQAGLVLAARARRYAGRVLGISVALPAEQLRRDLAELASATAAHLGIGIGFAEDDFDVDDSYLGGGYGVVSSLEREAVRTAARSEGLLLDPVYTGRAFGGLMDLIRRGVFAAQERLVFWHTGGVASLFAHPDI